MKLDGELWAGRCRFAAVGSLMGSSSLEGGRWYETAWRSLTFVVFDAPHAGGTYLQRLEKARARIAATGPPDRCVAMLARQFIYPFRRRPHRRLYLQAHRRCAGDTGSGRGGQGRAAAARGCPRRRGARAAAQRG